MNKIIDLAYKLRVIKNIIFPTYHSLRHAIQDHDSSKDNFYFIWRSFFFCFMTVETWLSISKLDVCQ